EGRRAGAGRSGRLAAEDLHAPFSKSCSTLKSAKPTGLPGNAPSPIVWVNRLHPVSAPPQSAPVTSFTAPRRGIRMVSAELPGTEEPPPEIQGFQLLEPIGEGGM